MPLASDDVAQYVNNKWTLYGACVRNNLLMPAYRDAITTYDFCEKVYEKKIWVPKVGECMM